MKMIFTFDIPSEEYLNNTLNWEMTQDEICDFLSNWSYNELVDFLGYPQITFERKEKTNN